MKYRSLILFLSCAGFTAAVLLPLRALLGVSFRPRAEAVARSCADDFDGDGAADVLLTAAAGSVLEWRVDSASSPAEIRFALGSSAAVPVVGDYDGDGRTDLGFYTPGFQPSREHPDNWEIWLSDGEKNAPGRMPPVREDALRFSWGTGDDRAVPADYDGDGRTDPAVFDPKSGMWHVAFMAAGPNFAKAGLGLGDSGIIRQWGLAGDRPVAADYDGDKKADFAVVRISGDALEWWIAFRRGGEKKIVFGELSDIPVPADYNGDGRTDIAVFREAGAGAKGSWKILSGSGKEVSVEWCGPGYEPLARDFDGDGRADPGCFASGRSPSREILLGALTGRGRAVFAEAGPAVAVREPPFLNFSTAGALLRAHQFR